jgi:adenosylhomocysteine nucleosidase
MNTPYLIITALEGELDKNKVPKEIPVVFSGVGKINATLATIKAIQEFQPKKIINFGTVGKINSKLSGLVGIQKVIQRDMLTEPLAPRGKTPFCKKPSEFLSELGQYTCGTGDSFVTSNDDWLIQQGVDVVDMELFAIAAVAHEHQIPWISLKFITDDANNDSGNDWQENISSGEELFLKELTKFLNS